MPLKNSDRRPVTADALKALTLQYLRYDKKHPLVALEADNADVRAATKSRRLIEVEVKTSLPDLRRDVKKDKYYAYRRK